MRNSPTTRLLIGLNAFAGLVLLAGCGGTAPGRGGITGKVTLDGAEMARGNIVFIPVEGNEGNVAGGAITDGRYELTGDAGPSVGWNRVEIRSLRKSGRRVPKPLAPPGEMVEEEEEAVAEQFNVESTLKVQVQSGDNLHDFDVTSRKRGGRQR